MATKWSTLIILISAATISLSWGQNRGLRHYDPKTEVTVTGTISDVQEVSGVRKGWTGTHLIVKTDAGDTDVHVGPSSYVAGKQFSFAKGDAVEVVGSKVTMAGKEVVLAREITRGGKTLVLRNSQGIPEWSGRPQ